MPRKRVDVTDLASAEEIAAALGVKRPLVHYWRKERTNDFPEPIRKLGTGDSKGVYVWSRRDINRWAKKVGREIDWKKADESQKSPA